MKRKYGVVHEAEPGYADENRQNNSMAKTFQDAAYGDLKLFLLFRLERCLLLRHDCKMRLVIEL